MNQTSADLGIPRFTQIPTRSNAPGINGYSGDQLPYVPKLSTTLGAEYDWRAFGDYSGFVGGSWSYSGSRFSDFSLTPTSSHLSVPSYDTFAFQGGLRNGRYTFEVYGKNLGDTRGITYYYPGIPAIAYPASANFIRPRTIGARVTADF